MRKEKLFKRQNFISELREVAAEIEKLCEQTHTRGLYGILSYGDRAILHGVRANCLRDALLLEENEIEKVFLNDRIRF